MTNLVLGISITLNVIFIILIYIYLKYKAMGKKAMEKQFQEMFYPDKDIDEMLNKL